MRKSLDTLGIPQEQLLQEQMALFAKVSPVSFAHTCDSRCVVAVIALLILWSLIHIPLHRPAMR